jgi:Lectin C-type domain
MVRCAAVLCVLAGCYNPSPREGAPCETSAQCPSPQRCVLGSCSLHDAAPPVDARPNPDAALDAPIDALVLACSTAGLTCIGTPIMFSCGKSCWVRCTGSVPRETARTRCADWMGALGQIDDMTEEICVAGGAGMPNHVVADSWIGLIQDNAATAPKLGWTWNGAGQIVFSRWAAGEPEDSDNNENGDEQCGNIRTDGTWDDQSCSNLLDFFCERPQP